MNETKSKEKNNKKERKSPENLHKLRAKKALALLIIFFGSIFGMQFFQIGPWTLEPGLKHPYLSYIGDPRYKMGISCGTPTRCELSLEYGENKSMDQSISDKKPTKLHFFELKNLENDTKYYWKLTCDDDDIEIEYLDKKYSFRTAPAEKKSFKITLIGDTRPDEFGISRFPKLMELMIEEDPEFMINVGDIVTGPSYSYHWDRFFYDIRECANIGAPYMIGLGNHEWNERVIGEPDKGKTYLEYMNYPYKENYYAFNYSNAAFISLDTNEGEITDKQLDDVEDWLKAANNAKKAGILDWIIIFGHYPIYADGGRSDRVADAFEELFIDYNVDMYLAGHVHYYGRYEEDGITYLISGGGGAETDRAIGKPKNCKQSAIVFQYCTIKIDGDELILRCVSHNDVLIDKCKLEPRYE